VGAWSSDGAKIAYISDADGEDEVYVINQDGSGKAEQLTHDFHAMLYAPEWHRTESESRSPIRRKLFVLTLEDKKAVQVAQDPGGRLRITSGRPTEDILHLQRRTRTGSGRSTYGAWRTDKCIA